MAAEDLSINQLINPLNELTRKIRRNLLIASVLGITIVKVGLLPVKISAFGITFSQTNQSSLLILIALIILYFLITFVVYMSSEMTAWNLKFRVKELERLKSGDENISLDDEGYEKILDYMARYKKITFISKVIFNIRIFIEIGVPLCVSIYGITIIYLSVVK